MPPKIKIEGPLKVGSKVYISQSDNRIFTTIKEKASTTITDPVGTIVSGPSIKLTFLAEQALASLE